MHSPAGPVYTPRPGTGYQERTARDVIRVKARMNESLDQLLKRFKKACEKEGLTRDIKRTAYYEKPSEVRRRRQRQLMRQVVNKARKEGRGPRR